MRRLALLSAVVFALGVLAGAPAARAATPPVLRPSAQATSPAFLRQMAQALARTRSYQVTIQTASAGYGTPIKATSTAIVLRWGTTLRLHVITTTQRAGQVSTVEEVLTGTHLCLRTSARGAWSCGAASSSALGGLQSADPAQVAKALGLSQHDVPLGRQTRQAQACLGYRFTLTTSGLRGQGTLWIARATALPVEEDMVSSVPLRRGAPPLVVRTTQRWSRWNDPRLTIPSVPAS
jgi:hypothetical protein